MSEKKFDVNGQENIIVSICVIAYNQGPYIEDCLRSLVEQQSDFPFEIVVRDDASQDSTAALIAAFQQKYPHLIVMLDGSKNLGMNKNILEVFKAARGRYLALCEGDDYWIDTQKIQKQYQALEGALHTDMCCHPALISKGSYLGQHKNLGSEKNLTIPVHEIIKNDGSYIATPSIMIRKEVISQLPDWFAEAPIGDYFIQVCGALKGGCLYLPEAMAVYRQCSAASWSKEMQDNKKRKLFLEKYLHSLQLFSEYIGCEYRHEFDKIKSKAYSSIAMNALLLNAKEDFKKHIRLSWSTFPRASLKQKIIYYLRFSPSFLRGCYFLMSTFKKMKELR